MCFNTIHDHVHIVAQMCHDSSENIQADIVARVAQMGEVIYSGTACSRSVRYWQHRTRRAIIQLYHETFPNCKGTKSTLDLVNEFQSFRLGIVAPSTGTGGGFHCGCTVAIFPLERCDDDVDRFAQVGCLAVGRRLVRWKVENDRVARARVAKLCGRKSGGAGRSRGRSKGADDGKQLGIDELLVMLQEEGTSHTQL